MNSVISHQNQFIVSSMSEYIEKIQKLQDLYPSDSSNNSFVYRGMSDSGYLLIPKVLRGKSITIDEYNEAKKETYSESKIKDLLKRKSRYTRWASEKEILEQFIQEASGFVHISPDNLIRWAEYAQHYGVPTRFLDWSSNPLTALYFSIIDNSNKDGSVWVLHKNNYENYWDKQSKNGYYSEDIITKKQKLLDDIFSSTVEYPVLYTPDYVDSRMSAQGSYFMVWGIQEMPLDIMLENAPKLDLDNENSHFGSKKEVETLKDRCYMRLNGGEDVNRSEAMLFKFHIDATSKQDLLRNLDLMGINEKMLFPGLDGIGKYVERKNYFNT